MKDILQDVFRVARITHPAPDEMPKPRTLTQNGCSEVVVSFEHRVRGRRRFHTSVDDWGAGILWRAGKKAVSGPARGEWGFGGGKKIMLFLARPGVDKSRKPRSRSAQAAEGSAGHPPLVEV